MAQYFYEICNDACLLELVIRLQWKAAEPDKGCNSPVHSAGGRSCKLYLLLQLPRRSAWPRRTGRMSKDVRRLQKDKTKKSRSSCVRWREQFLNDTCWEDLMEVQAHQRIDKSCWNKFRRGRREVHPKQAYFDRRAGLRRSRQGDFTHQASHTELL